MTLFIGSLKLAASIGVTLLAMGGAQPAQAETQSLEPVLPTQHISENLPPSSLPEQALVALSDKSASRSSVQAASVSPAGCVGYTDYAHYSSGQSSVHGRTKCTYSAGQLGVTTDLQHHAWFGWNTLNSDTKESWQRDRTYDATPHNNCCSSNQNEFRGISSHYSIESGTTYSSNTVGVVKTFGC